MKVIFASQVVLPGEKVQVKAAIEVNQGSGRINKVRKGEDKDSKRYAQHGQEEVEFVVIPEGCLVLPGLVDAHVHLNQPGRTAWEGFSSGTLAAISGGVTTLIDMPLNSIPSTTSVHALEVKVQAARLGWENLEASQHAKEKERRDQNSFNKGGSEESGLGRILDLYGLADSDGKESKGGVWCDVGFWGGIVPGNEDELVPMVEAGVKGFKCFLIDSGVDEFPAVNEEQVQIAMNRLKNTGSVILFHAEHGEPGPNIDLTQNTYQTFLSSRPDSWEISAIEIIIRRLEAQSQDPTITTPTRAHIVHLSSSLALPIIIAARSKGLPLTVETCFHYLFLSTNHVPHDQDIPATEYKCCPPIRTESNRDALWEALEQGHIDYVVSDHSPCVPELKKGGFMDAWGGVSGLGLGLGLMWTEVMRRNELKKVGKLEGQEVGIEKVVEWCCGKTAEQVGLLGKKGVIQEGADADFAIFDPNATWQVDREELKFKNKVSPYIGKTLQGRVEQTHLRGNLVYDRQAGGVVSEGRLGNLL